MTEVLELFRYATGNGFWNFVGCAFLLAIITDGAKSAALTLLSTLKR